MGVALKILHTADWHLGKRLERFSRLEEQREALAEICEIADREKVDAVLIAGDIYDTFNPPTEAEDLFYQTVKRLAAGGKRAVIAIAGNHDSPDRINAPAPLARACGIILAGYPDHETKPFALENGFRITRSEKGFVELAFSPGKPPLRLLLTPYANEKRLRTCLGFEDTEQELRQLLQRRWQELADAYCDEQGVNILMTHLFLTERGGKLPEESEDEKSILHVGGAQAIFSENVPAQLQYVALGHLHRKQTIAETPCPMVYSSSPLAYSMSEAGQEKYAILIEANAAKPVDYKAIPLKSGKKLHREKFSDVESAVNWLTAHPKALVELTMATETFLMAEERSRLYQAHQGIVTIIPDVQNAAAIDAQINPKEIDLEKNMEALFSDYFQHRHQQSPNDELLALFRELLTR